MPPASSSAGSKTIRRHLARGQILGDLRVQLVLLVDVADEFDGLHSSSSLMI